MNSREYLLLICLFLAWFMFLGITYLEQRGPSRGRLLNAGLVIQWGAVFAIFFNLISRLKFFEGQSDLYAGGSTIVLALLLILHCRNAKELPKQTRIVGMAAMLVAMVVIMGGLLFFQN